MKYGIYFAYWTREWRADYKYYIDKVKKLGFDILEISCAAFDTMYQTDAEIEELGKYAADRGVILTAGYGPTKARNIGDEDNEVRKSAVAYYKQLLPKLKLAGIKVCGGGLYSYWPLDPNTPMDIPAETARSVESMKEIVKVAEECDVVLGMESLNRFEGCMINTAAKALEYVNAVGSDYCKIMLDTFHMNIEEDNIGAAIRLAGDKLGHFHIGEKNRRVPGKGSMPWGEIGQALRDINYQGAAVMEPFVLSGGQVGSDIKVWNDLTPGITEEMLDSDAKGAVDFCRHVFGM